MNGKLGLVGGSQIGEFDDCGFNLGPRFDVFADRMCHAFASRFLIILVADLITRHAHGIEQTVVKAE